MKLFKKLLPLLLAVSVFTVGSLAYFSPVLKGFKIQQSDITQFIGMAKEINDFRATEFEEPFWTNSSFVGMPSYQLSTYYPNDILKTVDGWLRFLPRPADYLFLYLLSFFFLLRSLKVESKLALVGAFAFGFSTYLIIILGVGHNAKAHAIAYMPLVLSGIVYSIDQKFIKGFLLLTLGMGLEINASHPQMTYYLMFSVLFLGLVWLVELIRNKGNWQAFIKSMSLMLVSVFLAIGMNAASLMATKEYADFSTRSKSDLSIDASGVPLKEVKKGLSKDYITEYSYGWLESFDLVYSRFMGGGNSEPLSRKSATYGFLAPKIGAGNALSFTKSAPTYWGDQPIVAAPAYIGGSIFFLFLLGVFLVKGRWKYWLISASVFSLLLSLGKNFSVLTNFFIDYIPLYDKFRAVSSIQVILELAVPVLAILGLKQWFSSEVSEQEKLNTLKKVMGGLGGLSLGLMIFGGGLFSFSGGSDAYFDNMIPGFSDVLKVDRKAMLFQDTLKTLVLILGVSGVLYAYLKGKLNYLYSILILGVLWTFDLVQVDKRYVNNDDFALARKVDVPFQESEVDRLILQDKSYYRVANLAGNMMTDGRTSYFHHALGGYHAAKPKRFQDLYDFYLSKNHMGIYDMLNTKYFIIPSEKGDVVQVNPGANGNAWFVDKLQVDPSNDDVIMGLGEANTKELALAYVGDLDLRESAQMTFSKDSLAKIDLVQYALNDLVYETSNKNAGFAVFSEAYYAPGWNAYLDGNKVAHYRVDYMLRGMDVPAGEHEIRFKFEPRIIQLGGWINLVSALLFLVVLGGLILVDYRQKK